MPANLENSAVATGLEKVSFYSIPSLRRSPGEGNGYTLKYSDLENSMDSIVHGVAKSWTLALFVVMLSKAHLTSYSRVSGSRSVITPL